MRVAVLGCGYWGKHLVRNFRELGALASIVDPSPASRAAAADLAPGAAVFADAMRVWSDETIDAVVIATPASTHAELCRTALEAGKDVLCEKPLALEYEPARRLAALARRRERVLMVGHVLEYHPAILALRALVAQGDLGELRYIYSHRLNLGKVRKEENILWSFAPHDTAVILRITGSLPSQVVAGGGAYLQPGIYDTTLTQLSFPNGVLAHIFVSWINPFKEQRLVVIGAQKMVAFDDVRRELILYDQRVDITNGEPIAVRGVGVSIPYSTEEPLRLECQAFLDAVRTRHPPLTDAESALQVLRVLQAAQTSLLTHGHPAPLPSG